MTSSLRTFSKIAWRESRASATKFTFVILAVALGVGSLTGVRGFSRAFNRTLLTQARTLMAADLSLRVFAMPTPAQAEVMHKYEALGAQRTWLTETVTMVSVPGASIEQQTPLLCSVKAVDPNVYPFYGEVNLIPPANIRDVLNANTAAVSEDLLIRLKIHAGDSVRIGGQDFKVVGIVDTEPDRMSGSLNVGPRIMMARSALERTGLLIPGSRASERFLFKIPATGINVGAMRNDLKRAFPDALISDFRQTNPAIEQGLERATTFLSLVSLIALIVGALGVATAIQAHLSQRMDSIAVMKCLGARSSQILSIYVIQTAGLGLAGGVIGIVFGLLVERAFPIFLDRYFHLKADSTWDFVTAGQGIAIALLTTLLFTLPPLLSIKRIRPGLIFRREMASESPGRAWFAKVRESIAAGVLILIGIGFVAAWLSSSVQMGVYFVLGLTGSLLLLSIVAWALMRGLKMLSKGAGRTLRPSIRHGIANLYRPGNHAQSALVALGIGVMFTLTVYLVQRGLLTELVKSAPPGMPNVFLLDITPRIKDGVIAIASQQKGIQSKLELVGTVSARIVNINGTSFDRTNLKGLSRRYAREISVAIDPNLKPGELSISEESAKVLNLQVGSKIDWTTPAKQFSSTVAKIHKIDQTRLNARIEFLLSADTLAGSPAIYYGAIRVQAPMVPALQRAIYNSYPTVTVVNIADVLQIVQGVVDQISLVIRFISAFAILAGAIILASSVAGTRFRRIREVVILKTIGATRGRVAEIFSVEFLILGSVAGLMGALLATGFSNVLLHKLLDAPLRFDLWPNLFCVLLTAFVANVAGWLASYRILGQKPLEVLRHE
jgi:putative ABC transport system permease protein